MEAILKQGRYVIATLQPSFSDDELRGLCDALVAQVVQHRVRGVIVDVTAVDVMDSCATRTVRDIGRMARECGADTIVCGMRHDVAFAMDQLGLSFDGIATVADRYEGVLLLESRASERGAVPVGEGKVCVPIAKSEDIVRARQLGRTMAGELGFSPRDVTLIATAISELARNILQYAGEGEIEVSAIESGQEQGLAVVATDRGPGIENVQRALQRGYSTSGGLGLGLPGVRQLVDDFRIESAPGRGTTVSTQKWRR
ncbi:MAG: ATP-binding protein [Polyangiaceae bacterium]|nr:ATP-binding protein [Polyangiaceae bacterium]